MSVVKKLTIEEKLDWILAKAKAGEFDLLKVDKETGKLRDQLLRQELYANPKPLSDDDRYSVHEWVQLKDILIEDEKLIEEFAFSFGSKYVLTVKGKMFEGFSERKKRLNEDKNRVLRLENIQVWMVIFTSILAFGTLIASVYYLIDIFKNCHCF